MIDIHSITGDIEAKMKLYGRPVDITRLWRYRECIGILVPVMNVRHGIVLVSFPPHLLTESLKQHIEDLGGRSSGITIGEGFSEVTMTTCHIRENIKARHDVSAILEELTEEFIDEVLGEE